MKSFVDEVANWVTITSAFFVWPLLSLIGIVILLIRPGLRRQVVSTIRRLPFLTTLQRQFDQDPGNGRIAAKLILKQPSTERGDLVFLHHKGCEHKTSKYCPQFAYAALLWINDQPEASGKMIEKIYCEAEGSRAEAELRGNHSRSQVEQDALTAANEEFFQEPLRRAGVEPDHRYGE